MTAEEKTKHLEALENMFNDACRGVSNLATDPDEFEYGDKADYRTAIDAFEAQAAEIERLHLIAIHHELLVPAIAELETKLKERDAEIERLRTGLAEAQESIYAAHDAVHEASRIIDVTLDPSDDDSNGDPPEQTPHDCNPDLELLKAAVNAIAKDIETDGRTGKRKTALSDSVGIASRLYAITGASK